MSAVLPDAEVLYAELLRQLKPRITADTGVVGIMTGGAWLAERLHRELGITPPLGVLDISFYRDDFDQTGLSRNVKPLEVAVEQVLVLDRKETGNFGLSLSSSHRQRQA